MPRFRAGEHMSACTDQGVFISYRREDTGPYARLLKVKLSERFPDAQVFMDLDSIEAGLDFAEVIESALALVRGPGRPDRPRLADDHRRGRAAGASTTRMTMYDSKS